MKMLVKKNPQFQVMKMSVKKMLVKKMTVKKMTVKKNLPVPESCCYFLVARVRPSPMFMRTTWTLSSRASLSFRAFRASVSSLLSLERHAKVMIPNFASIHQIAKTLTYFVNKCEQKKTMLAKQLSFNCTGTAN